MLVEILGALVGFVALILLLSLVVTALVQATQSGLRLRGRNLFRGLRSLFDEALAADKNQPEAGPPAAPVVAVPPPTLSKDLASLITGTEALLPLLNDPRPSTSLALLGPTRSWITKEELLETLRDPLAKFPAGATKVVDRVFERWEARSRKDFEYLMRVLTVVWGLVVAVTFQVNSPAVLKRLSNDADMRKQYNAVADSLLGRADKSIARLASYEDVSATALDRIEKQFPADASSIEQVSGADANKGDLLAELGLALEGSPRRPDVMAAYSRELDALQKEESEAIQEELAMSLGDLSRLEVRPWGQGTRFYWTGGLVWQNVVGVLVTTILLAFGAPFWFERLKELARLRDALAPKKP